MLVLDRIGKDISGLGMDSNVVGRYYGSDRPSARVQRIIVRDLTDETEGNAVGIGMADVVLRRAVERMDVAKTYMNAITAKTPEGARIPLTVDTDREALDLAIACCLKVQAETARIVRILDTKHLGWFYASEPLLTELLATGQCEVAGSVARMLRHRGQVSDGSTAGVMVGASRSARSVGAFLDGLSPARHGALIYIAAGLVFVATDLLTKTLVANLPVVHVVFGRHVSYLLAVLVLAGGRQPRRLLATKRPWTQLARGPRDVRGYGLVLLRPFAAADGRGEHARINDAADRRRPRRAAPRGAGHAVRRHRRAGRVRRGGSAGWARSDPAERGHAGPAGQRPSSWRSSAC